MPFWPSHAINHVSIQVVTRQGNPFFYAADSSCGQGCGIGGMLLAAIDQVKQNGDDQCIFFGKIYDQGKNLMTALSKNPSLSFYDGFWYCTIMFNTF
jgi:hypothetical protein